MSNEEPRQDDKRSTAGRYLINFLEEVNTLSNWNSLYFNLIAEVQFMAKKNSVEDYMKEMEQSQKTEFIRQIQETRFYVTKTWTTLQSMREVLRIKDDDKNMEELTKLKGTIQNDFIIKRDDVERFTILINTFLVNDIIKELLRNNEDLVNSLSN